MSGKSYKTLPFSCIACTACQQLPDLHELHDLPADNRMSILVSVRPPPSQTVLLPRPVALLFLPLRRPVREGPRAEMVHEQVAA
jgi:hypothetical protein